MGNSTIFSKCIVGIHRSKIFREISDNLLYNYGINEIFSDDNLYRLKLWNCEVGKSLRSSIPNTLYKKADGFIFVYDLTSRDSFRH